jgi:hypothetical protein
VLAWPIRECRLRYPDGLDQAQARDPLVGMEPHPEARQTRTQRLFVCAPRGLEGGGIRSLFRAELALRRFLAPFWGPASAAHFGISGRLTSREAETGFDSEGRPVRSCNTPFPSAAAQASGCDQGQNLAEEICEVLETKGCVCGYTLLIASFYGVPQMRERMFLIGYWREVADRVIFPRPTRQLSSICWRTCSGPDRASVPPPDGAHPEAFRVSGRSSIVEARQPAFHRAPSREPFTCVDAVCSKASHSSWSLERLVQSCCRRQLHRPHKGAR